jgi:hypothetical protein
LDPFAAITVIADFAIDWLAVSCHVVAIKASDFPSGDHVGLPSSRASRVSCRSRVPSARTTKRSATSPFLATNAIVPLKGFAWLSPKPATTSVAATASPIQKVRRPTAFTIVLTLA